MIKNYNFQVSEEEKRRILNLHESRTKKMYLIEQKVVTFPRKQLGDKFEYGKYESENVKNEILTLKPQIEEFLRKYSGSTFVVNILAGESQVTNPAGFETKGSLALARAQQVSKYFKEIFPEQISSGIMTINVPKLENVTIGKTPYRKGDQNNPELKKLYRQEQFVDFYIEGQSKEVPEEKKFSCNTEIKNAAGYFLPSSSFFAQTTEWNLGKGEGELYFYTESYVVPDILFLEYNGVVYGNREFKGDGSIPYSIMVATPLRAKFGSDSALPKNYFGDTKFRSLNINVREDYSQIMKFLELILGEGGLYQNFFNTFGPGQEFYNPAFVEAFRKFDANQNSKKNRNKLILELGPDFPWAILTSEVYPSIEKNIGPIKKIEGLDFIRLFNVSPCGSTKWSVKGYCKPF